MFESLAETARNLGPDFIYLTLMVGLWLAITGIYTPGTGFIELSAAAAVTLGALGLFVLDGQIAGLVLLIGALACFIILIFYRRFWQLVVVGGALQLAGSFFLFPADSRPSIAAIILMTVISLAYHELILRPGLRTFNRPAWLDDQTLVGAEGIVIRTLNPQGMIRIEGELWRARTVEGQTIEHGEMVVVQARKGLEVVVARHDRGASDTT